MSLQNIWHLRRVADTAARACYICYKPSSSVLITPDNKDFFYVCPVHLKDRNFCSAIVDVEEQEVKRKKEAMDAEIEKVKREYEEKQRRKKEKSKEKEKEKAADKEEDKKKDDQKSASEEKDTKADEKERDDKIASIQKSESTPSADDSPRIFALHKNFYAMRLERLRNAEAAKRNRQRMQDPSFFPSVPSGGI
ncbi:DUF1742-domain-containing protein [Aspergillus steynii IBT 23096]|uniref:DUF1742-domain-containing protein n=1 Tax=Aspergillus steynii IBT 23096 TaxID=1392250 RepID=A0A2I2GNG5_9EURO|nr:DUF1742-domain-containing protein [Aspergillus steynii IBT 23096]PLB54425.1 DUF1742-domain-containing protein [Aspergillus steynii IBT 23096]